MKMRFPKTLKGLKKRFGANAVVDLATRQLTTDEMNRRRTVKHARKAKKRSARVSLEKLRQVALETGDVAFQEILAKLTK